MKDYYQLLGVDRSADQEDIKRAYRKLARLYHPDVNRSDKEAQARFKEISEAYEVLGDAERRRRYDLFGEKGVPSSSFGSGFGGFDSPFGDIFDMFFAQGGGRRTSRAQRRGSDLLLAMEITLHEAYNGVEREEGIPRNAPCEDCGGTGVKKGYTLDICPECGGEGRITRTRRSSFGAFSSTTTCRRCGGTGEINTHPCHSCGGRGSKQTEDKVKVNIPAGINNGDRIRIPGKGEAGVRGAPPGDLYVEVFVEEHDTFKREGDDLQAVVEVSMAEAALGTELSIPTLDGEEKLHVHSGSQPGEIFKIRGKGMPRLRSKGRGDLYLILGVQIPDNLNAEQRRLLEDYQRIEEEKENATTLGERLRKVMRPRT
ncbi:MAG: molecular chaperone DnaJ [Actinomycetota bacterium]